MPRPITEKYLQTHYQCTCGCNVVEGSTIKMKTTDFKKLGDKIKKDKQTGEVFYNWLQPLQFCYSCSPE